MEQQAPSPSRLLAPSATGHTWLASRLLHRQVVNVSTLEPIGRVADVIFDPLRCQTVGITVQVDQVDQVKAAPRHLATSIGRAFRRRNAVGAIALEHIVSLNGDVVMVATDPIRSPSVRLFNHMPHLTEVCEFVILTTYGMSLGSFADLLLDYRGSAVAGYVVTPTELAGSLLPTLEDLEDIEESASQWIAAAALDAPEIPPVPTLPASQLRVIPASSHVRFGDSLILLVAEVEPLAQKVVVVSKQA